MKTKKRLWALAAAAIVLAGCSSPTDPYDDPIVIANVAINVAAPVAGGVQATATATAGTGANFSVGAVAWYPQRYRYFYYESEYTATVTLTAIADHVFAGGLATATINGQAATVSNNTGSTVTLAFGFPATGSAVAGPTVIANAAVNVTAPVTGETPVTTATPGAGAFTVGTVTWDPAHSPFQGETQYTATVTLTANAGHIFAGALTATVNGQAATVVPGNTGATVTLSRTFAATGPGQDPVIAAWQFTGNTSVGNAIVGPENITVLPSGGQQRDYALLQFIALYDGELTPRVLNAMSSGVNVLPAGGAPTSPPSSGLGGLAGNAWWQTAISTTDRTDIAVTWHMRSTNTGPRDWRLQYRVGGTDTWNNVGGTVGLPRDPDASTLNAPEQGRFLPPSAEGHERLYLRWLMASGFSVAGGTAVDAGTHQINNLVIRSGANPADFDNRDDQTGAFTIEWTGFTNPRARGVTITGGTSAGEISINDPNNVIVAGSIQWLDDFLVTIGGDATLPLPLDGFPRLLTVRVRTTGSERTYSIVFDTVTGQVFN